MVTTVENISENIIYIYNYIVYQQPWTFHPYYCWLVVWNMTFIFPKSWDDDPIWLKKNHGGRCHLAELRWPTETSETWKSFPVPWKSGRTVAPLRPDVGALGSPGDVGMWINLWYCLISHGKFQWEETRGKIDARLWNHMKSLILGDKIMGTQVFCHMIHRDFHASSCSIAGCAFRKGGPATKTPVTINDLVAVDHRISEVHEIPRVGQFLPNSNG